MSKANGTIEDLKCRQRYRVIRDFVDRAGNTFRLGETLTYQRQEFFESVGFVVQFDERILNLHEGKNAEIVSKIWAFIEPDNG